jgi:hypothetical protein
VIGALQASSTKWVEASPALPLYNKREGFYDLSFSPPYGVGRAGGEAFLGVRSKKGSSMAQTLSDKFFIKAGHRVAVMNAPESYLIDTLQLPQGAALSQELDGTFDQIQYFMTTRQQITEIIQTLKEHLKTGGALWLNYPKGGAKASIPTDVNRDTLHDLIKSYGLEANRQISIDDTWSALRFTIAE